MEIVLDYYINRSGINYLYTIFAKLKISHQSNKDKCI